MILKFERHWYILLSMFSGGTIIGCAPIIASESLEAFQYPNFDFQIIQTSPHENSTLMMSGQVTRSSSYAILNSAWMTNGLCPVSDAEIYNPLDTSPPGNDVINRYACISATDRKKSTNLYCS